MGWSLEIYVETRDGQKPVLADAFLKWALPSAGDDGKLEVDAGWKEALRDERRIPIGKLGEEAPRYFAADRRKERAVMRLLLQASPGSGDSIPVSISAPGQDQYPGSVPCTHWIDLGRPDPWSRAPRALRDGRVTGPAMLSDLVRHMARATRLGFVRLLAEQSVHDPISCHLVHHSDPRDFLTDLLEVVRLGLRGGAHYHEYDGQTFASLLRSDPRASYGPTATAASDDYMVFLGRSSTHRDELRQALVTLGPLVDQHGVPPELDATWVREQLHHAPDCVVFESDDGGLGVHDYPFLGANYLDGPYLTLLRAVAARLADRSSDPG